VDAIADATRVLLGELEVRPSGASARAWWSRRSWSALPAPQHGAMAVLRRLAGWLTDW